MNHTDRNEHHSGADAGGEMASEATEVGIRKKRTQKRSSVASANAPVSSVASRNGRVGFLKVNPTEGEGGRFLCHMAVCTFNPLGQKCTYTLSMPPRPSAGKHRKSNGLWRCSG